MMKITLVSSKIWVVISLYALFSLGLVVVFSTTSAELLDQGGNGSYYGPLLRQMSYAVGGFFLGLFAYLLGCERWLRAAPLLLLFSIFLLLFLLVPGIAREVNGARRWLQVGTFSLQPSEFLKIILPLYLSDRVRHGHIEGWSSFLRILSCPFIAIFLVLLEPNNGTAGMLICTLLAQFFLVGVRFRYWAFPLLFLFCLAVGAVCYVPYVRTRVESFIHPEKDLLGRGHQPYQAKIAVGSGGLWGRGPGNGWQKLYLPEAQNDYIAAIYAEEFGFQGMIMLIGLYMVVGVALALLSLEAREGAHGCLVGGIAFVLLFQAMLNLAVVAGLFPSTGLNLPFFSQGGSSLLANSWGIGMALSVEVGEGENSS